MWTHVVICELSDSSKTSSHLLSLGSNQCFLSSQGDSTEGCHKQIWKLAKVRKPREKLTAVYKQAQVAETYRIKLLVDAQKYIMQTGETVPQH